MMNSKSTPFCCFLLAVLCSAALLPAQTPATMSAPTAPIDYRTQAAIFALAAPTPEPPATRPSHVPPTPLPSAQLRSAPVTLPTTRPATQPRPALDQPPLAASADPARPARPLLTAGPRVSVPNDSEPWLPLSSLGKLRPESPVRPHEPVLDPMGRTSLSLLPVWRTTPAAAQRAQIPDPFENIINLPTQLPDDDPPVAPLGSPSRITMTLEKPPATPPTPPTPPPPPATQPAKPATQPATLPTK